MEGHRKFHTVHLVCNAFKGQQAEGQGQGHEATQSTGVKCTVTKQWIYNLQTTMKYVPSKSYV